MLFELHRIIKFSGKSFVPTVEFFPIFKIIPIFLKRFCGKFLCNLFILTVKNCTNRLNVSSESSLKAIYSNNRCLPKAFGAPPTFLQTILWLRRPLSLRRNWGHPGAPQRDGKYRTAFLNLGSIEPKGFGESVSRVGQ